MPKSPPRKHLDDRRIGSLVAKITMTEYQGPAHILAWGDDADVLHKLHGGQAFSMAVTSVQTEVTPGEYDPIAKQHELGGVYFIICGTNIQPGQHDPEFDTPNKYFENDGDRYSYWSRMFDRETDFPCSFLEKDPVFTTFAEDLKGQHVN